MPAALTAISDWLPLSYVIDAVNAVATGDEGWELGRPLIVICAVLMVSLLLASLTLRRRTP
jgi:ABC-type multidrug transport system permease subunit